MKVKALLSFKISVNAHPMTQHHIAGDFVLQRQSVRTENIVTFELYMVLTLSGPYRWLPPVSQFNLLGLLGLLIDLNLICCIEVVTCL
jgi:hypothetical protein